MGLKAWMVGKVVSNFLKKFKVDKANRKTVVTAIKNIMTNKKTLKNEPVLFGGIITVAVALASAFGLDLTAEQLGITVSTLIAIVSFVQRSLVSPTRKGE